MYTLHRARENMQFEKVKKEVINSKKRDFVQNHTFYAKNIYFAESKKCCAKVNLSGKNE